MVLADQISCRSYVGSVYRKRSFAVSGFYNVLHKLPIRDYLQLKKCSRSFPTWGWIRVFRSSGLCIGDSLILFTNDSSKRLQLEFTEIICQQSYFWALKKNSRCFFISPCSPPAL